MNAAIPLENTKNRKIYAVSQCMIPQKGAGLILTQDKEGYFGYVPSYGAYVEVISYDKLLKDARQRNQVLFDKLFYSKADELVFPELANGCDKS